MKPFSRTDLEQDHSRVEMEAFIELFHDPAHFPSDDIYRLKGIEKTMIDEYIPLYHLLVHLSGRSARLTADSNCGPDGIVTLPDGKTIGVQITTSHRDKQEGLGRQMHLQGQPYFPNRTRTDGKDEHGKRMVTEKGRMLTTPDARISKVVGEVESALRKKIAGFRSNTDALLISGEMRKVPESWKDGVRAVLASVPSNPYRRVFVGDTSGIYIEYEVET